MKSTNAKLSFMMFIEWFIWGGAWFVPLWQILNTNGFTPTEIAWCYASTAIAAILSPILVGSITDRFFPAQKVLSVMLLAGAALMYLAGQQTEFSSFFPLLLLYALTYMPTIALTNSIAFPMLKTSKETFHVYVYSALLVGLHRELPLVFFLDGWGGMATSPQAISH